MANSIPIAELEAMFHRRRGFNETLPWGCGITVAQARRLVSAGICAWVEEPKYSLNDRRWKWRIKLKEQPREQSQEGEGDQRQASAGTAQALPPGRSEDSYREEEAR